VDKQSFQALAELLVSEEIDPKVASESQEKDVDKNLLSKKMGQTKVTGMHCGSWDQ